ncbi:hypothetical protein HIM_00144 [Hirsutella minnesotensis 3608]|nr:hypothetical protein HIM_00144 [Hirsutella minnesotensis 3608]
MSGEGPESIPTSADPRSRRPTKKRALSPASAQAASRRPGPAPARAPRDHQSQRDGETFERERAEQLRRDDEKTRRNREKRDKAKARKARARNEPAASAGAGAGAAAGDAAVVAGVSAAQQGAKLRVEDQGARQDAAEKNEIAPVSSAAPAPGLVIHDDDDD